jgi:putative ABC transport system permease protein
MRWLTKLPLRLRSLFSRRRADQELSEELQFHLQSQIDEYVAAGMEPKDACCAALRSIGGLTQVQEECRNMRQVSHIENLLQDLRYGVRTLIKYRGFTAVVVVTLALGIGINTAVFSLVHGILLEPLPYDHPRELVKLGKTSLTKGILTGLQQRLKQTEVATVALDAGFNLSGNGQAVRLTGNEVSSNLFSILRATPHLGRVFRPGDEVPGKDRLVILSYALWQSKFGSDPAIVGRTVVLDDEGREVVGVMPSGFSFPSPATQLWVPAKIDFSNTGDLWNFGYNIIGRTRPGATLAEARAEFSVVFPQVFKTCPFPLSDWFWKDTDMGPLQEFTTSGARTTLLSLLGAVALILLIACVNVASLLLSRSTIREREMAIRTALGASRPRIVAQLLTESVLLGAIAGMVGCGLAFFGLMALKAVLPAETPRLASTGIDGYVLGFSAALSVFSGMIFGLAPALQASKPDIEQALRANSQSAGISNRRKRLSAILVVAEISMAVILASSAGLLIKSLWGLTHLHLGFSEHQLLLADLAPSDGFCGKHNGCVEFYHDLVGRARALPGVESAALTAVVPLESLAGVPLTVQGQPDTMTSPHLAWYAHVSPEYFRTMGISLLQGRDFSRSDRQDAPSVAVVSKTLAQLLWPGDDPLGKHVRMSDAHFPNGDRWITVVGVVDDVRHFKVPPANAAATLRGDIYFPFTQLPASPMSLVLRSPTDLGVLGRSLPGTLATLSAEVPVTRVRTIAEIVAHSESSPRSTMWLFSIFAGLALFLGAIGIYSVLSYSVAQRTREIGIRMAMGASKGQVLRMILRQGAKLVFTGILMGLAGALVLTRLMASLLHGVRPSDPVTMMMVSAVVAVAATLATCIPSLRATLVNPIIALRSE